MCYKCELAEQVQQTTEFWDPKEQPLSAAELADSVRKASIDNPDKVYERQPYSGCLYTHDVPNSTGLKTPGCIVGQGVYDVTGKVVDDSLMRGSVGNSIWLEALNATTGEKNVYGDPIAAGDPLTRYLMAWLKAVQGQQDEGHKWSDAVAYADRTVRFSRYAS